MNDLLYYIHTSLLVLDGCLTITTQLFKLKSVLTSLKAVPALIQL